MLYIFLTKEGVVVFFPGGDLSREDGGTLPQNSHKPYLDQ